MDELERSAAGSKPVRTVSREEAVFWLDARGCWRNRHGRVEHPRIARHLHASIRRDERGYHVVQEHPGYLEKVYFPFEDTALFVRDLKRGEQARLVLNTGRQAPLDPEGLVVRGDSLYVRLGEEWAKFTPEALVKLAACMDFSQEPPVLELPQGSFPVAWPGVENLRSGKG